MTSDLFFARGDRVVPLTIRAAPRARRLRLRVDPRTGAVVLTLPPRLSRQRAIRWAAGHRAWVESQLGAIAAASPLAHGSTLPFRGVTRRIDWQADRPRAIALEADRLVVGGPREGLEARILRWLRREAAALLAAETREFAARADVTVVRTGVGDPVSRWGSCAATGTIRYSWRLVLAPDWVRRATVAHEVAHRIHMNHGPHFHALVAALLGADPAPARQWLRREGAALHRVGRAD